MKKVFLFFDFLSLTLSYASEIKLKNDYPIKMVNFWEVKIEDEFWKQRLEMNRKVTISYLFKMNEETGRVDNFRIAGSLKIR